jgi:diphthamide synthase (EF-2-diphthine--ammonia ligase)
MLVRVLVLSSGGKDSCYAVWWALLQGWDVAGIVTVRVSGDDSMMFQLPSTALAGLQAASAGIPWLPVIVSGEPEVEIGQLETALLPQVRGIAGSLDEVHSNNWTEEEWATFWPPNWPRPANLIRMHSQTPIDGLVSGALRSDYQRTRLDRMAERLAIKSFAPLWHNSASKHMQDLLEQRFSMMLTSVSADGLTEEWVGRSLDQQSLGELGVVAARYGFTVDGEGGEFETAVVSAPWMNSRISIEGAPLWQGQRGQFDIETASLTE